MSFITHSVGQSVIPPPFQSTKGSETAIFGAATPLAKKAFGSKTEAEIAGIGTGKTANDVIGLNYSSDDASQTQTLGSK